MNSIERIVRVINFKTPDRVPVIAQVFGHAAIVSKVSLHDYIRDGELLANSQINALKRYKYDAVFALMDVLVESEAIGSVLEYRKDHYPLCKKFALSETSDLDLLSIPDPYQAKRMPELLKAAEILKAQLGDETLIVGCVLGPMTLTCQLLGAEGALNLAINETEKFSRILNFSKKVAIQFGLAQIEAGVHLPIVFEPFGSPAVVPHQFFREFILTHLKEIFSKFKKAGAATNWLHIAGHTGSILSYYPEMGVNIANFDYYVNPLEAQKLLPRTCLDGNIKSLSFIEATPAEILKESQKLLEIFAKRGGYILSSGCEIPPESNPKNIEAMVNATKL
jgi:uroporphyrinogen decarboxylase